MGFPALKYYTAEAYLALEREAAEKHEFYKGEIFAMAGASFKHNQLQKNFIVEVGAFLRGKSCDVFGSDLRVHNPFNTLFTYPDAVIVCGKPEWEDGLFDTLLNPSVIVEILSPSTQRYERGDKFMLYRSVPSLQEYILIDSESVGIEHFRRNKDNTWLLQEYKEQTEKLFISTIGFSLPVNELYNGVTIG